MRALIKTLAVALFLLIIGGLAQLHIIMKYME